MIRTCTDCGSSNVNELEVGDEDTPSLLECEDCDAQYEDDEHELAG